MGIPPEILPSWLIYTSLGIYAAGVLAALRKAPWNALRDPTILNLALGAGVCLVALWRIKAGLQPGLAFHFLAVTTVTLMLGWSLAVIATFAAVFSLTLILGEPIVGIGIDGILTGLLPASLSYLIYHLYEKWLPRHLFVYIFAVAFFGGATVAVVTVCARAGLLTLIGAYSLDRLSSEYLPFLPLYAFPEAVLNGMLVTVLSVYRPGWMKTLDESTIA